MLPHNMVEIAFTSCAMLVNLTVYAYILGEISNLVMNQDEELVAQRSELQTVQKFVFSRNLPEDLRSDIMKFFDSSQASQGGTNVDGHHIFNKLCHTLQVDVAKYMSRNLISLVSIFRGCNDRFLDSLSVLLHEVTVPPDNYLFRLNDVSREMYIVSGGVIEKTIDDGERGEVVDGVLKA
eukprot:evm.model.scf_4193.1 EVM.evm.TU.scf_4193.1   scf_4193:508-1443(+)